MKVRFAMPLLVVGLSLAACGGGDATGTDTSAVVTTSQALGPAPLSLHLESDGGSGSGPIEVAVILTNETDDTITVVRPFISPNFVRFSLTDDNGVTVSFDGPYLRLEPLQAGDFADLASSDSVSHTFDLTALYTIGPGAYTVGAEYRNPAGGSHEGGGAFTAEPGEGIDAEQISVEVRP